MASTMRIALLIDADNASASSLDYVLGEIAELGTANVRRAYGDWGSPNLKGWRESLLDNAIQPVQQVAYTSKGNASDMAMVIEAMDLLHGGGFDAFALVSSDSDFTPLVMRLREANMHVYGFGKAQTPNAFKRACSVFFHVDSIPEGSAVEQVAALSPSAVAAPVKPQEQAAASTSAIKPVQPPRRKTGAELRGDTSLVNNLRNAMEATDRDGWSHLGAVGHYLVNRNSFTSKNYGYASLKGLITATDLFELHKDGNHIRAKPMKQVVKKAAKKAGMKKPAPTNASP